MSDHDHNDDMEKALLSAIWVNDRADLLKFLDRNVFASRENQLVFDELRLMHEAGWPFNDELLAAKWFSSPSTKRRWASAHGDAWVPNVSAASVFSVFLAPANLEYYLREVLKDWSARAQAIIAEAWLADLKRNGDDPMQVFARFQSMLDRYYEKTAERFPESLEGTV